MWRFDPVAGNFKRLIAPNELGAPKAGGMNTLGFTLDAQGRRWITKNHRLDAKPYVMNEVAIYRTSAFDAASATSSRAPTRRTPASTCSR